MPGGGQHLMLLPCRAADTASQNPEPMSLPMVSFDVGRYIPRAWGSPTRLTMSQGVNPLVEPARECAALRWVM